MRLVTAPWMRTAVAAGMVAAASVAHAEKPATLLAPAPTELVEAENELSRRVLRAEAIGRATTRLHNAAEYLEDPCEGDFLLRAAAFGQVWRDATQRARAQALRTRLIAEAGTLAPLMNEARLQAIDALMARAEAQGRSWLEFDRLQKKGPACEGQLKPSPGLDDPTPRAIGEEDVPVAIWVLTGTLCPGSRDEVGVAVVDGPACVDLDVLCACDPKPQLPGAVVTP